MSLGVWLTKAECLEALKSTQGKFEKRNWPETEVQVLWLKEEIFSH